MDKHSVCEFLKRHRLAAAAGILVVALADIGFICWQRTVQDRLIAELVEPGALPGSAIITARTREESFFARRDRIRVTLASSTFSDNPSDAPLTLDFDVAANFGPFGLTGDIFPLNDTQSSARLLMALEGKHPQLQIRYRWAVLKGELQISAQLSPFDMRISREEAGVGPTAWRFASDKKITLKLRASELPRVEASADLPHFQMQFLDPAKNVVGLQVEGGRLQNRFDAAKEDGHRGWQFREWFLKELDGSAKQVDLITGDWRGALKSGFKDVKASAVQTAEVAGDTFDGRYSLEARTADFSIESPRVPTGQGELAAERLALRVEAKNVPAALMEPLDDIELERVLRQAGLMKFTIDELEFTSAGQEARIAADLTTGLDADGAPTLSMNIRSTLPERALRLIETILRGSRRSLADASLDSLMVKSETPQGSVYTMDLHGSLGEGLVLNGQRLPVAFTAAPPSH